VSKASRAGLEPIPEDWGATEAVGAIIIVGGLGYLLQLRDERKGIWYPGYWGLFGGTLETGETAEAALCRELAEELSLTGATMRYFMSMSLSFANAGARIHRDLFEVRVAPAVVAGMRLGEGREMRGWAAPTIPALRLVPADRLALDFHMQQNPSRPSMRG
jgi:8-oxo-dGTP pyrophosphatase MutT (NUDIX family)